MDGVVSLYYNLYLMRPTGWLVMKKMIKFIEPIRYIVRNGILEKDWSGNFRWVIFNWLLKRLDIEISQSELQKYPRRNVVTAVAITGL